MESFLSESCGSRGGRCCGESAFQKEAPAPGKQPGGVSHRLGLCLPQPGGEHRQNPPAPGKGSAAPNPTGERRAAPAPAVVRRSRQHHPSALLRQGITALGARSVWLRRVLPALVGHIFLQGRAGAGQPGAPPGWPSLPTGPWASHLMPLCRQLAVITVEPDRWMPGGEARSHGLELAPGSTLDPGLD